MPRKPNHIVDANEMVKHTPGPWTFDDEGDRIYITPTDRPCHYIADLNTPETDPEGDYPREAQREANARLIAAAPELLEACKTAALSFKTCGLDFKYLEDAIAKAEGK